VPARLAPSASGTRDDLIAAGLHLFGQKGYAATSTRELAGRAKTNIGSIAYHFGSKSGLHLACADAVARRIGEVTGAPQPHRDIAPERAAMMLEAMVRAMVGFLVVGRQAEDMVAFILRELSGPSAAIDALYDAFIEPKHRELCDLWAAATGRDPDSEAVKLAVFAMVGQIVYFRIGRQVVLRRLGWDRIGPEAAAGIAEVVAANLRSALERSKQP
jgi:AcrR family transcriptional regulator